MSRTPSSQPSRAEPSQAESSRGDPSPELQWAEPRAEPDLEQAEPRASQSRAKKRSLRRAAIPNGTKSSFDPDRAKSGTFGW